MAAVRDAETRACGRPGDVAGRLDALRADLERERYLQLLPGYVRRFVEKGAALLDLEIRGDLDGAFSLRPRRTGALDALLPALESHPPAARERWRVRRPAAEEEPCIWLHPGEPVFDALSRQVCDRFARDALRGGIFTDPRAEAPYLVHLALASVEQEMEPAEAGVFAVADAPGAADLRFDRGARRPDGVPAADVPGTTGRVRETLVPGGPDAAKPDLAGAAPTRGSAVFPSASADAAKPDLAGAARAFGGAPPAGRQVLERRLVALRQDADGATAECPVEHLLLLHGAPEVAPGAVPLAGRGIGLRASAAEYAGREVAARMAEEHRAALRAEMPEQRRRTAVGLDLRAADLARRRAALSKGAARGGAEQAAGAGGARTGGAGAEERAALRAVVEEQRALSAERRRILAAVETAPGRIAAGAVRFLAHALVVPARASAELERYDARVEEIAVRIAAGWERERGAEVRDVSRPALARQAGLPDWPGFDLLSTRPDGAVRNVEVKGRAGRGGVQVETNEWKQACHLGDRYWLYVVLDCATPAPRLVRVRDPFSKLLAASRASFAHVISAAALVEAAEED